MDDFDVLEQARSNPESLWAGTNQVILDEVQKAPELLLAVKKTLNGDLPVTVQPSFPTGTMCEERMLRLGSAQAP